MPMSPRTAFIALALAIIPLTGLAKTETLIQHRHFDEVGFSNVPEFAMTEAPVGDAQAPASADRPEFLRGSTIATFAGDVLVADADSGKLVRTDRDGKKVATLDIGRDVAQLVVDVKAKKAFVTDRANDRVLVVDLADGLKKVDAFTTRTEPYGIALSPERDRILVTTIADKTLTAYDLGTGFEAWSLEIGHEPRGVALSADGRDALVTFLTTGVVGHVDLSKKDPSISYVSLDPNPPSAAADPTGRGLPAKGDEGRSFARNAFAAMFVGNDVAVVPHQLSTPHLGDANGQEFESSGYGGGSGFVSPITHRLAFLELPDAGSKSSAVQTAFAQTNVHQPRAMAYDGRSDTLYVAGFGSDDVMAVADVSQASVHLAWKRPLTPGTACGPNGITVDADDGSVVAFCSLTRKTVRLTPGESNNAVAVGTPSAELTKSHLSASAQRGAEIFRRGNSPQLSTQGAMACASCHAEARADGLSWFLTGNILQTPFLSGRVIGAHPFKWDGKDHDLDASLTNTVKRLGGSGLTKRDVKDLTAFLAATSTPRTPTVEDAEAVARGKELFESDATGCGDCHYGALLTDKKRHEIASDLPAVDTPSLIGLANSAPYYHDGSAATLGALLRGKGNIHGMGRTSKLTEGQIGDLVAYMETL
jgi:DNA-binding beta-propeller fold protein YncE